MSTAHTLTLIAALTGALAFPKIQPSPETDADNTTSTASSAAEVRVIVQEAEAEAEKAHNEARKLQAEAAKMRADAEKSRAKALRMQKRAVASAGEAVEAPEPPEPPEPAEMAEVPEVPEVPAIPEVASFNAFSSEDFWGAAAGRSAPAVTIVATSTGRTNLAQELQEDLPVMSRILGKVVQKPSKQDPYATAMGVHLVVPFEGRGPQSTFIEGFGVLFQLQVRFPLISTSSPAPQAEKKNEDSTWERTKKEMYGGRSNVSVTRATPSRSKSVPFSAEKVESLKTGLLESLKQAHNIRNLEENDTVTVVVQGSAGNGSRIYVASNLSHATTLTTQSSSGLPGTMVIKAKKADIDALAEEKIDQDEFNKRAVVAVY